MLLLHLVTALALAASTTGICVHPGAVNACPKGDASSKTCVPPADPEPPRFRLGDGPWYRADASAWSCVPLAVGERRWFVLGDQGANAEVPADCASGILDANIDDFYGGMRLTCSTRKAHDLDRWAPIAAN